MVVNGIVVALPSAMVASTSTLMLLVKPSFSGSDAFRNRTRRATLWVPKTPFTTSRSEQVGGTATRASCAFGRRIGIEPVCEREDECNCVTN